LRVRDLEGFGARLSRLVSLAARARWIVAALCVAAAVVVLAKGESMWARNLSPLSSLSVEDQAFDGRLRTDLGAADARYLVVAAGRDQEEALAAAERAGASLQPLVARGELAGFDSPAHILPSLATQEARAASLPDPGELRARLTRALRGLPLRPARLEGFVADVAQVRAGVRLRREDLEGSGLGVALDALLVRHADGWRAMLPLRAPVGGIDARPIDAAQVREALVGSGAQFLDLKQEADALYAGYLREAMALSATGVAVVLLALMVALRSAARVGRVAAPLGAAVLVTAALLALAGQALTLLHLVGFLLVVAVGSNYALFFDRRAVEGAVAGRVIASLAVANATTVIGFGVLASSSVPVLRALGLTVALGTLLALAFAALLSGTRADAG
jgi:predicted exporter